MLPFAGLRCEKRANSRADGQQRELGSSCGSAGSLRLLSRISTYPKSPKEMTNGMMYFPRMLDKIRLHARGELHEDYHKNFGTPRTADSACCNFLRVHHRDLRER